MSLTKPTKKMSKSDEAQSYIGLFDEPNAIKEKIMRATTDTGKTIKYDPEKKAGVSNLLTIYSLFSGKTIKDIEKKFEGKGYADFKKSLAELLVDSLEPFRRKRKELLQREVYVREILEHGRRKAEIMAQSTIAEAKKKMGLI
jgi:tryptophanyl-tRNA synthetase